MSPTRLVALLAALAPAPGDNGMFFYLSFEHPFRGAGPTEAQQASAAKPASGERG